MMTPERLAELRDTVPNWSRFYNTACVHAAADLLAEVERLRGVIERERTWSNEWITRVRAEIRNRRGISQSRGSYEWDDDEYMKEFGAALDAIENGLDKATRDTNCRSWTDCPTTQEKVDAARAGLFAATTPPAPVTAAGRVGEQWQLTKARTALENWGRHHEWCACRYTVPQPCSCGLAQAIADANSVAVANSANAANTVTDAMVERAARAMYAEDRPLDAEWDDATRCDGSYYRTLARRALTAALGEAAGMGEGHPDTRRLDWLDARVRAETPWRDTVVMFDHEDGMWLAEAERGEIRARALCHWRDATKDIRQAIDAARAQEAPRGPA